MIIGKFVVVAVVAYLLGAIPFALIISKKLAGVDISEHGSGNIGSTNVYRVLGRKAGVIAVVLDLAKAFIAVMTAKYIIGDSVLMLADTPMTWQWGQALAALMVMVGHNWSVYIKFRGGKGVATYFGRFAGVILLLTILRSRYMSLGSLLSATGVLILFIVLTVGYDFPFVYLVYSMIATALMFYQHRTNIDRLGNGTESRLR
jgi:glycerol-3-phosphate acyltransferase PlsY